MTNVAVLSLEVLVAGITAMVWIVLDGVVNKNVI